MGRADSPLRDRVVFIDGAPRSGTTWLVTLLATHRQIAGVEAESHLFDFGVDRLFDNLERRHPELRGLAAYLEREQLVELVRDLCDGILLAMRAHVSRGTEPEFVVEKTPVGARDDGLDLVRKRDVYPDAWYLHIVRDREAVTKSLMRAPFMEDRSYEACAAVWDRVVGDIRRHLGDLPRYREVRYEALRDDPAATCAEIFDWLGVDSGEPALDVVRALSRERFSDLGTVPRGSSGSVRAIVRSLPRRAVARAAALRGPRSGGDRSQVGFSFVSAMRTRDPERLRALTHPGLELVVRSASADDVLVGDDARAALVDLAERTFDRRFVGEWWASPGDGSQEWWTSAPGKPFCPVFFSAIGGDATRVDFAVGLELEDAVIRRATLIAAGPSNGRPIGAS
jgi:hypothetical protein